MALLEREERYELRPILERARRRDLSTLLGLETKCGLGPLLEQEEGEDLPHPGTGEET